ncbi:MAG: septal ring lytic transglycosylase RlpA family protein [Acidobacteriia bacterium]|nr:septal ring lytic transglycosylase RlpA family protein [Terriglobia bacterium]
MQRPRGWFRLNTSGLALGLLCVLLGGTACGPRQPVQPPVSSTLTPSEVSPGYELQGVASYYGDRHQGHPTANGEIFDKAKMTAAHRTLPFNTQVRVHNLKNHKTVTVRINDRGPYVPGRIIDLSEAAGMQLGMGHSGTTPVRLEILSAPAERNAVYTVQVGAFSSEKRAKKLRQKLVRRYNNTTVTPYDSSAGKIYRVRVGQENNLAKANQLAQQLLGENLPAVVVRSEE